MAKSNKKQKTLKEVGGRKEIKRLWKKISPPDWLTLLQEIAPDNKWQMQGQSVIKGCCPYHNDNSPSFVLSFHKSMGKCFGSTCEKVVVDIVNLIAKLRHSSYTEALLFLNNRFQLSEVLQTNADELNKYNNIQEMKKQVAVAMNQVLIEVIRDDPEHLAYCRPAIAYLRDVRKIPLDVLHILPVGVFAKPEHLKKHIAEAYLHPLMDEYFSKYQSTPFWGALTFHYNDSPGSITRFKLRLRDLSVPAGVPKTQALAEMDPLTKAKMYQRQFAYVEDPYVEHLGVFGLHKYQHMVGANDTNAYVTEGEFDVLSVMAAQDMKDSAEFMLLGTGGKGGTNLGFLREFGINTCWLIPDHPAKNGDDWALSILADKHNFDAGYNTRPLAMRIFQWQADIEGMDLDEAVRKNGYDTLVDFLYRKRTSFFLNAAPWVIKKCDADIAKIQKKFTAEMSALDIDDPTVEVQRSNLTDEKQHAIKDTLLFWFRYVHEQADKLSFTQKYAVNDGIDISKLQEVSTEVHALDTIEGVANFVADHLEKYFTVAYYESRTTGNAIYLWSNHREEPVELKMNEQGMFQVLAQYIGGNVIQWLDRLLGSNEVYLSGTKGDPLEEMRKKRRNAKDILVYTLEAIIHRAQNKTDLLMLAQGIHYIDLPQKQRSENQIYFVNGKKVFRGKFTAPGEMEWEHLNSMVDDGILFENLNRTARWSFVEDETDLYAANQVDLKRVYDRLCVILDGWMFEHHEVIKPYLAAYIMSLPIMRAVGNVNITFITGEKESGKTSLADGLLGGTQKQSGDRVPVVLESSLPMYDATEAALHQFFAGSSQLCVLDEAESSSKHNTKHDQRNAEMMRLMYSLPMGGVNIRRGGVTRDKKTSHMIRMPVLMAGINIPTDSTFLSRVLIINTVKDPGRKNLTDYIYDNFSEQDMEDLRRGITVGLLPHIPEIIKRRRDLRVRLPEVGRKYAMVSNRFVDSVLTPLAVYEMLGFDAEDLYAKIVSCYKDRLESIHGQDAQSTMLNACLYTESIKVANEDTMTDYVSAKSLILKGEFNTLNNSDCGVYYLTKHNWIIIVWRQVKYTLLNRTRYAYQEESAMREQAAKNPYVVPEVTKEDQDDIQYFLRLADVKGSSDYTVLKAGYLVKQEVAPLPPKASDSGDDENEEPTDNFEDMVDFSL